MPQRFLQTQTLTGFPSAASDQGLLRDIVWGRPVFRPPQLPNPRVVFDPLPFRTQLFSRALRAPRFPAR